MTTDESKAEENMDETKTEAVSSKKNSISSDEVERITAGIPRYEKASFLVIGHRGGVRIALPKTNGVGRAYFYGNGDYSLVPTHEAITVFSEEDRREHHRGGIMAEVNFSLGVELATDALARLVAIVAAAEAPAPKGAKAPKEPKEPKAPKAPKKPKAASAPVHSGDDEDDDLETQIDHGPA